MLKEEAPAVAYLYSEVTTTSHDQKPITNHTFSSVLKTLTHQVIINLRIKDVPLSFIAFGLFHGNIIN